MSAAGTSAFEVSDARVIDFALAALERAVKHLPWCPWCDGKACALPRGGMRCTWCGLQTLDARDAPGARLWRRTA